MEYQKHLAMNLYFRIWIKICPWVRNREYSKVDKFILKQYQKPGSLAIAQSTSLMVYNRDATSRIETWTQLTGFYYSYRCCGGQCPPY